MLRRILAIRKDKAYRVRDGQRKLNCPHPDYQTAFIVIPGEWLGIHAIRRDAAVRSAQNNVDPEYALSDSIRELAVAIALLDDWGNIPGIEDKDPQNWHFERVPIPIMEWLVEAVLADFALAFVVPKASSGE